MQYEEFVLRQLKRNEKIYSVCMKVFLVFMIVFVLALIGILIGGLGIEMTIFDMNLMLIIVQENDAESLASAFKRSQIQATRIDAKGLVSSRKLNVFLVGTERTDEVLQLVSSNCKERAMEIEDQEYNGHMFVDVQKTIVIGGATIFFLGEARLMKVKGGCCGD